ncbi:hypothetical protein [Solimicrobium silvestre]|uniref:Uncharacterized protein n=1 Tax=Solimicrobium silvestre TaxID=2099400 RepID=A0A2S9GWG4_9BURK|nr:hypothetical protein [Solimicrobium silvestre]PRC92031.1 hypothetical protein S2091_3166 [Solimicrobium silvestre]
MKKISINPIALFPLTALLFFVLPSQQAYAQTKTAQDLAPLNLDTAQIAKEISHDEHDEHVEKHTETLSAAPNKFTESFSKAAVVRRGPPTVEEIHEQGTTDRVDKVIPVWGDEYCVYSPSQGRTDGIDPIQTGMPTQFRSCPHYF